MKAKQPHYPSPAGVKQRAKELRKQMTAAEEILWEHLRKKQLLGLKFRRQHPLDRFILDFYCHAHRLVIEVDGDIHKLQHDYDGNRTKWLEQRGYTVIRFRNEEVVSDIQTVLQKIAVACSFSG